MSWRAPVVDVAGRSGSPSLPRGSTRHCGRRPPGHRDDCRPAGAAWKLAQLEQGVGVGLIDRHAGLIAQRRLCARVAASGLGRAGIGQGRSQIPAAVGRILLQHIAVGAGHQGRTPIDDVIAVGQVELARREAIDLHDLYAPLGRRARAADVLHRDRRRAGGRAGDHQLVGRRVVGAKPRADFQAAALAGIVAGDRRAEAAARSRRDDALVGRRANASRSGQPRARQHIHGSAQDAVHLQRARADGGVPVNAALLPDSVSVPAPSLLKLDAPEKAVPMTTS